ncbi:MAG: hypothetical protein JXA28_00565 [Bacteroidetes bacterium]|nr:hypothetical protein [Bacteroidota bacterium]
MKCGRTLAVLSLFLLLPLLHAGAQIPGFDLQCSVIGPDSVFFDKVEFNRYLPGTFTVDVVLVNPGNLAVDSVVAFPRSNQRFTIIPPSSKLLAARFAPGDTLYTDFALQVNPRSLSGLDTITIAISGKEGARTECSWVIWVEKEYKPANELQCPGSGSISIAFVDTLNSYIPDPFAVHLVVTNRGDAPSKETRLLYVATPDLKLADGQSGVIDIGVLQPNEQVERTFLLNAVPRQDPTTVTLQFHVQGKGGLGDRIIEAGCSFDLDIPPVHEVLFELACESDPEIEFVDGAYVPNPFPWNVVVRNTGDSRAKDVRVVISLPVAYALEGSSSSEIMIGDMEAQSETPVQWIVRARDVFEPDTSEICVRVFDRFNRMAECCDSLILPAVREPDLDVSCLIIPDTIRVDTQTGLYQPAEFIVDALLRNTGTDPADSVYAEIIVTDPNIRFVSPPRSRIFVSASMPPSAQEQVQWTLAPLPVQHPRDLDIRVRIVSSNSPTVSTICTVHIAAALVPELSCVAATVPDDTLHYGIATLEYDPLTFTATVFNNGSIAARDMQATILLPPNISLPSEESAVKYLGQPLPPDSFWTVTWQLTPETKRDGALDSIRVEFRSTALSTTCGDWIFIIGIPPVTVFTLPRDIVERHGREFTASILIDESQNKDIKDIELFVEYDDRLVTFLAWERDGTLLERNWNISAGGGNGRVSFHAHNPGTPLEGTGELLRMRFRVRFGDGADILRWAISPLDFDTLASSVNRGSILARYYHGQAMVSGDCLYPLEATRNFVIGNRPNPFNPSTSIDVTLADPAYVTLEILDALGRSVTVLHEGDLRAGTRSFLFDAAQLPSGTYIAVLRAAGTPVAYHRMLLLR